MLLCLMSDGLVIAAFYQHIESAVLTIFSLTSVSASIHVNKNISHAHLHAFNHFLVLKFCEGI